MKQVTDLTIPIIYSFKNRGSVTCSVSSGNVAIVLNDGSPVICGANAGSARLFNKSKLDDTGEWNVKINKVSDKAMVVFTAP